MKKNPNTKAAQQKLKSKLARRALKLWFELGRLVKGPYCEHCGAKNGELNEKGKPQWLNGHHVEEKMNYSLRFDPMNHVLLCPTCHKYGVTSAHRSPLWFIPWLTERLPAKVDYLQRHRLSRPTAFANWTLTMIQDQVVVLEAALKHWKETHLA